MRKLLLMGALMTATGLRAQEAGQCWIQCSDKITSFRAQIVKMSGQAHKAGDKEKGGLLWKEYERVVEDTNPALAAINAALMSKTPCPHAPNLAAVKTASAARLKEMEIVPDLKKEDNRQTQDNQGKDGSQSAPASNGNDNPGNQEENKQGKDNKNQGNDRQDAVSDAQQPAPNLPKQDRQDNPQNQPSP